MKTYPLSPATQSKLEKAFLSHPPLQDQAPRFESINEKLLQTGRYLCGLTPDSEEQREMLRHLKIAQWYAEEAIRKNEMG